MIELLLIKMAGFFFHGYFFQAVETYACPVLDIIIIVYLARLVRAIQGAR